MYINSPGGIVTSGLSIYDTMQYVRPEISTLCIGQAASMGSLLLAAGHPGKGFLYQIVESCFISPQEDFKDKLLILPYMLKKS